MWSVHQYLHTRDPSNWAKMEPTKERERERNTVKSKRKRVHEHIRVHVYFKKEREKRNACIQQHVHAF